MAAALACCGCGGWARLSLISTDQSRIPEKAPLVFELNAAQCTYWIDGERINVALADENLSLIGEVGKKELVASIVLDGLPADRARDYSLDQNSIRGRFRHGARHSRFASLSGILGLWLEGPDRIRGRWRAVAKQQEYNVLQGWTGNQRILLLGEFEAVHDRQRTETLLARSEEGGLTRSLAGTDTDQPRPVVGPAVRRSPPPNAEEHPADPASP